MSASAIAQAVVAVVKREPSSEEGARYIVVGIWGLFGGSQTDMAVVLDVVEEISRLRSQDDIFSPIRSFGVEPAGVCLLIPDPERSISDADLSRLTRHINNSAKTLVASSGGVRLEDLAIGVGLAASVPKLFWERYGDVLRYILVWEGNRRLIPSLYSMFFKHPDFWFLRRAVAIPVLMTEDIAKIRRA